MTQDDLTAMMLASYDAEAEAMADRVANDIASMADPQQIEERLRFESRRAQAGIQRRFNELVGGA